MTEGDKSANDRSDYAQVATALGACSYLPGSWDKQFARHVAVRAKHGSDADFSERERAILLELAHKYRRQLSGSILTLAQSLAANVAKGSQQ